MTSALTVLVVDDEPDQLELARRHLELAGFRVHTAGSAGQGALLLGRVRPAALVTDQVMPGVDGTQLVASFRQTVPGARTAVLYWTAHPSRDLDKRARDGGACDCVPKGQGGEALARRVMQALGWERVRGGLLVNRRERLAGYAGACSKPLTEWDLAFLVRAAQAPGGALSREEAARLRDGRAVNPDLTLNLAVLRLRRRLPPELRARLSTVLGQGWRLDLPAEGAPPGFPR